MLATAARAVLSASVLTLLVIAVGAHGLSAQDVEVTRAVIAADVEDREPVGESDHFAADVERVYFFTEFEGDFPESQFEHVWLFEGEETARVALTARGPRWRTWSSKALMPEWSGEWTARVVDSEGNELASVSFHVGG
jgi:hypothetical protein